MLADKWREVPGGSDLGDRQFSTDMRDMTDAALVAEWDRQQEEGAELRGWWWRLYAAQLHGRKVLEIGSGMGFDALHFAQNGAHWTCCDIAPSNLAIIERVSAAKNVEIRTLPITSLASFDSLPRDFDAVWCCGSLLHIPFEDAREECAAILGHLKPGGRWIELAYPRERWVREGSPSFDEWGAMTDGPRTPWAEWYGMEKLKERLHPAGLQPLLEYRFHSDNYIWLDAEVVSRAAPSMKSAMRCPTPKGWLDATPGLWREAWSTALAGSAEASAVTVSVECTVERGSIGFALVRDGRHVSREIVVEARTGSQQIHLTTASFVDGVRLVTRNASALGAGRFEVTSIAMREAL
jgi:SAM-dependent methyltransferase